jgi:hypothetical protein
MVSVKELPAFVVNEYWVESKLELLTRLNEPSQRIFSSSPDIPAGALVKRWVDC